VVVIKTAGISYADLAVADIWMFSDSNVSNNNFTYYEQNTSTISAIGVIYDNWVAVGWFYGTYADALRYIGYMNITAWNFEINETVEISSGGCNIISDYTNDKIFFSTNKNSDDYISYGYGDARYNWDVYYTETSLTAMMNGLMDVMLPMIIVVVVIGLLGAFFAFKMN
jgi:hypothetical protein